MRHIGDRNKVYCAICDKPIENRRQLIVRRLRPFKWEAVHFQCRVNEIIASDAHWSRIDIAAVNSLTMKGFGYGFPILGAILIPLLILFGEPSEVLEVIRYLVPLMGVSIVFLILLIIAYFKYERKVPR